MALTAQLLAKITASYTGSDVFVAPEYRPEIKKLLDLTSGVAAGQADILWTSEARSIAASSSEDLDLAGALTNAFGASVAMVEVVAILVTAAAANTNNVVIGAATAPVPLFGGTAGTFAIPPGGFFFAAGTGLAGLFAVGAGATDDLKVANSGSGTAVVYDIVIIGRSA